MACRVALAVMFILLVWRLDVFIHLGIEALRWPYELDYAEGIVWQQARLMFTPEAYGPIDGFPTIVFHYTPLYHVLSRAVAAVTGADLLYTGRAISLCSTLAIAILIGLIVFRASPDGMERRPRLVMAAVGSLCVFSIYPILLSGEVMRVDMLAILLSIAGFWLGTGALERPRLIHPAAVLFVAALFTKQTMIAAPCALFGVLLWCRPRTAFAGIVTTALLGLAALIAVTAATGGGFLRHIFLYNINRISWRQLGHIVDIVAIQAPFFGVAIIMAQRRWNILHAHRKTQLGGAAPMTPADLTWIAILCYFITTSLMLVTLIKSGAFLNYFVEWLLIVVVLVGSAFTDAARVAIGEVPVPTVTFRLVLSAVIIPCAVAFQAMALDAPDAAKAGTIQRRHDLDVLSTRIRAAPKPVIADEMVLLQRSGKRVMLEPMIFTELASVGSWDERPFLRHILDRDFSMIVTDRPHDASRYTPAMWRAIDRAYPVTEQQAGFTLHLPAASETPIAPSPIPPADRPISAPRAR